MGEFPYDFNGQIAGIVGIQTQIPGPMKHSEKAENVHIAACRADSVGGSSRYGTSRVSYL
jgi:phosphoribosylformylglycinamidine (FGAM) synthase-like amidotransferase family enzyme